MAVGEGIYNSVLSAIGSGLEAGAKVVEPALNAFKGAVNKIPSPETQKQTEEAERTQRKFDYKFIQYPLKLATGTRTPYWMTFYINTQDLSEFKRPPSKGPEPLSTADINARSTRNLNKNFSIGKAKLGFGRKTHRTTTAIRLYMPDTLSWSYGNSFREASLSGIPGAGLAHALAAAPKFADSLSEGFKKGGVAGILASLDSPAGRSVGGPILETLGEATGVGADLGLQVLGISVNPQVDVLYQSPQLREFTFEFLFAPRTEQEASAVEDIIYLFKFYSAPEIFGPGGGVGLGRYFVPPSEFDIEFSVESMGRISTCVLQNLTVDYAPSGTAFYASDSRPVNTRLTLQFKEIEFMTKNLILKGF